MEYLVGRFTARFDHGVEQNKVGSALEGEVRDKLTSEGKVVRGLGTSYVSEEAAEKDKKLSIERGRIDRAFAREYLRSPIPGLYVLPNETAAKEFLASLNPLPDINARVVVYKLDAVDENAAEVQEWVEKIKAQFTMAPLGREQSMKWASSESGKEGLDIIKKLAECPVLGKETRDEIKKLIHQAKLRQVSREDFKRGISLIDYRVEGVSPPQITYVSIPYPKEEEVEEPVETPVVDVYGRQLNEFHVGDEVETLDNTKRHGIVIGLDESLIHGVPQDTARWTPLGFYSIPFVLDRGDYVAHKPGHVTWTRRSNLRIVKHVEGIQRPVEKPVQVQPVVEVEEPQGVSRPGMVMSFSEDDEE